MFDPVNGVLQNPVVKLTSDHDGYLAYIEFLSTVNVYGLHLAKLRRDVGGWHVLYEAFNETKVGDRAARRQWDRHEWVPVATDGTMGFP